MIKVFRKLTKSVFARGRYYLLAATTIVVAMQGCSDGFKIDSDGLPSEGLLAESSGIPPVNNSSSGFTPPAPKIPADVTCQVGADPGATPLRRLSKWHYTHTMVALLSGADLIATSGGYNEEWGVLSGPLAAVVDSIPFDAVSNQSLFSAADRSVHGDHIDAYAFIASSVADSIALQIDQKSTRFFDLLGANCVSDAIRVNQILSEVCRDDFINKFARLALRKKINDEDRLFFKNVASDFTVLREQVPGLIQAALLHPRFLMMVEIDSIPVQGRPGLFRLNDYEIAQRLGYYLLGSSPLASRDCAGTRAEMLDDAERGVFTASETSRRAAFQKYLAAPGPTYSCNAANGPLRNPISGDPNLSHNYGVLSHFQKNYINFYREWLNPNPVPFISEDAVTQKFLKDLEPFSPGFQTLHHGVYNSIRDETYNFVGRMTFDANGTYSDLLLNNSYWMNGTMVEYLTGFSPAANYVTRIQNLPGRAGLLTRAQFLYTGNADSHPINRGVFIRRRLLCDQLPSPSPDALPDRAITTPDANTNLTTRQRYEQKTSQRSCQGCHNLINPLGFALENFDSFGRDRTGRSEPVYTTAKNADGSTSAQVANRLPINARVNNVYIGANENVAAIDGAVEMSQMLASSGKSQMCFARQLFRHTMGRFETSQDGCLLQYMVNGQRNPAGGGIQRMLHALPLQEAFLTKKVGP
jgi:hypothetical protein